jgi:riboflavin synthase
MFTGIITDIGRVRHIEGEGARRVEIETAYDTGSIAIGASICCSGVCLTVVDKGDDWFAVDVSHETLSRATLGEWRAGTRVNLERALRVGDELGGHILTGHVDGLGTIAALGRDGASLRITVEMPEDLALYIASKGSVAIDGVSLTVNEVDDRTFGVNIIPHTLQETNLAGLSVGDRVNLEIDVLARYIARLTRTTLSDRA